MFRKTETSRTHAPRKGNACFFGNTCLTRVTADLLKMRKFRQLGADFDEQSFQQPPNAFYLGMFGINVAELLQIVYRS